MEAITYGTLVSKINLPNEDTYKYSDKDHEILGWGVQNCPKLTNNDYPNKNELKYAAVRIIDIVDCQKYYGRYNVRVYRDQICTIPKNGYPSLVNIFTSFIDFIDFIFHRYFKIFILKGTI